MNSNIYNNNNNDDLYERLFILRIALESDYTNELMIIKELKIHLIELNYPSYNIDNELNYFVTRAI